MKNLIWVILFFSLIVFVSCKKTIKIVPEFEYGIYSGYVNCFDEFGEKTDKSGVKVSVLGLEKYSAMTDENGYFNLYLPIGTYTFIYTKPGYGRHVHDKFTLIGGILPTVYFDAKLYKTVDVELREYQINYDASVGRIFYNATVKTSTPFSIYFGYTYDLNSDYLRLFSTHNGGTDDIYEDTEFYISDDIITGYNLGGHDTVYCALYSVNYYEWYFFYNEFGNAEYGSAVRLTEFQEIVLK